MKPKPYVGVTGPVTPQEVSGIIHEFENAGYSLESEYLPMIGFLVSFKTLNKQPTENRRYPKIDSLRGLIAQTKGKAFPMVHYNSRETETLAEQVETIFDGLYRENLCRAVQLNIAYPPRNQIVHIKENMQKLQIVFQASQSILEGQQPSDVARKIGEYGSLLDYILIDPSGGRGKEFDPEHAVQLHHELKKKMPETMIGFAGGFTGENVNTRVKNLMEKLGTEEFCIDAEGGLRDKITPESGYGQDTLNRSKVRSYLQQSAKVLC